MAALALRGVVPIAGDRVAEAARQFAARVRLVEVYVTSPTAGDR